jgi:type VI secretion system protein ImpC
MPEKKTAQTTEQTTTMVENLVAKLDAEQKSALKEFFSRLGKESAVYQVRPAVIDQITKDLDTVISAQMDEILHAPDFQELESSWRGLQFLVQNTEFSSPVKFELLDCTKEELFEDLEGAAGGEGYEKESALFHHLYWNAYDKVGGHPYTSIVGDFQFGKGSQDIKLLEHLAVLGETAQIPFISNVSATFFGPNKSLEKVMQDRSLPEQINDGPDYAAWRAFREDDRSKYVGLCLPRFLGRLPYGKDKEETKNFLYEEGVYREGKDNSLWCNASFALASNMVKAYEKWGWSVKLVGVDSGGRVENLPMPTYQEGGQTKLKVPLEASVGQAKDDELCKLGFIPLAHWDRTDYACFFELPSIQKPLEIKNDKQQTANYAVGARLQYTFLVTRIAHYLKYRQLRFVGKSAGAGEIKADLAKWLDTLVSDFPNPDEKIVAERPLRSYNLEVVPVDDRPGFFQVTAEFRPHVSIIGMDVNLRMVAYHSGEEEE